MTRFTPRARILVVVCASLLATIARAHPPVLIPSPNDFDQQRLRQKIASLQSNRQEQLYLHKSGSKEIRLLDARLKGLCASLRKLQAERHPVKPPSAPSFRLLGSTGA